MVLDLFALAAVAQSRWRDAALMRGNSLRIQARRNWRADPAEAALNADTQQALEKAFDRRELDGLLDLGASMAVSDVLALAGLE
jgi:hypothetical protein